MNAPPLQAQRLPLLEWRVLNERDVYEDMEWIATCATSQDAENIVHQHNAHNMLIKALRECFDWMRANLTDSDLSGIEAYREARSALITARS